MAILVCVLFGWIAATAHAELLWVNTTADPAADDGSGCLNQNNADTFPVTPDKVCSLRGALTAAAADNAAVGPGQTNGDVVEFDVPSGKLVLNAPLPHVPTGTFINGLSSGSGAAGASPFGVVELDGHTMSTPGPGLVLDGASDRVWGLLIHGFTDAIRMAGSGGHRLAYDGVGLDSTFGVPADPNTGDGIHVLAGSAGDQIVEPMDYDGIEVSGNQGWGIQLDAGSGPTTIQNVYIGTDSAGTGSIANGLGGIDVGSSGNHLGDVTCANTACSGPTTNNEQRPPGSVIAGNGGPGIRFEPGAANNTVAGNLIGIGEDGSTADPNQGDGILDLGDHQTIGGSGELGRNVIAGNTGNGITLGGTGTTVTNDHIGTDTAGTVAVPNQRTGILSSDTLTATGGHTLAGNVVSGNGRDGIDLRQTGTTVANNTIGLAAGATFQAGALTNATPLPNGGSGVLAERGPQTIGNYAGDLFNLISGNAGAGVAVSSALTGAPPLGVRIQTNTITGNGGAGIAYADDPLPAPALRAASANGQANVFHGSIAATPSTQYEIDVYKSARCDSSGSGPGAAQIATGLATTDAQGHAEFGQTGASPFGIGDTLTATITAPDGTTSVFSGCRTVTGPVDLVTTQSLAGDVNTVTAGEQVALAAHVANHGQTDATNVVLTETLPANTTLVAPPNHCTDLSAGTLQCRLPDLAPGATEDAEFLIQPTQAGRDINHVSVKSDQLQAPADDAASDFAITVAPSAAQQPVGGSQTSIQEPEPVFSESLRLDPDAGTVTARLPGGQPFKLTQFALVPVGTHVDASNGYVQVTAALPDNATQISSQFTGSGFRVTQPASKRGVVTLTMNTPLPGCTTPGPDEPEPAQATAARAKRKRSRRLTGKGKGDFEIRGSYGSSAVRGTHWRVLDTCASTIVRVFSGKVLASPVGNARPAAVLLSAGEQVTFHAAR